MTRHLVKSNTIHAIGYDPTRRVMRIEFRSFKPDQPQRIYEFSRVAPEQFTAFLAADSKGRHFGQNFKDKSKHPAKRVEA